MHGANSRWQRRGISTSSLLADSIQDDRMSTPAVFGSQLGDDLQNPIFSDGLDTRIGDDGGHSAVRIYEEEGTASDSQSDATQTRPVSRGLNDILTEYERQILAPVPQEWKDEMASAEHDADVMHMEPVSRTEDRSRSSSAGAESAPIASRGKDVGGVQPADETTMPPYLAPSSRHHDQKETILYAWRCWQDVSSRIVRPKSQDKQFRGAERAMDSHGQRTFRNLPVTYVAQCIQTRCMKMLHGRATLVQRAWKKLRAVNSLKKKRGSQQPRAQQVADSRLSCVPLVARDSIIELQAIARMKFQRRRYLEQKQWPMIPWYNLAAAEIQLVWRSYINKVMKDRTMKEERRMVDAVSVLQRFFRSKLSRKVFALYRDFVRLCELGDPKLALRAINPRESSLFDSASQLHVKLRLGGECFPPIIFYKIFTHAPLCDVNAFAPRDYTAEKPLSMEQTHNITAAGARPGGNTFAYNRFENNPWRPIAVKNLPDEFKEAVYVDTRFQEAAPFQAIPLLRKQELAKKRKQRKVAWYWKMYKKGMAEEGHAAHDEFDDNDVEELLQWSEHLDFETYFQDWTTLATTDGSEQIVRSRFPDLEVDAPAAPMPTLSYEDIMNGTSNMMGTMEAAYVTEYPVPGVLHAKEGSADAFLDDHRGRHVPISNSLSQYDSLKKH